MIHGPNDVARPIVGYLGELIWINGLRRTRGLTTEGSKVSADLRLYQFREDGFSTLNQRIKFVGLGGSPCHPIVKPTAGDFNRSIGDRF